MRPGNVAAALRPAIGGGSTGPNDAGTTHDARVVAVESVAELNRIARRGLLPSLPAGARVELTLLPADHPERSAWEHSVTRHASACGCEIAAVALTLVVGVLVAAYLLGAAAIGLPGAPIAVTWAVVCVCTVLLVKASVAHAARRSLRQLSAEIAAAARAGSA